MQNDPARLANSYYFNFLRPLVGTLRDPGHALHASVAALGDFQIVAASESDWFRCCT